MDDLFNEREEMIGDHPTVSVNSITDVNPPSHFDVTEPDLSIVESAPHLDNVNVREV